MHLKNGDRVCIIGGGPAGSFSALHLLRMAAQRQLRLEVLIFEPRDFRRAGPAGCNRCAGILSSRLVRGLSTLGLEIPQKVIQAHLSTYALMLDGDILRVHQPDLTRRIVSIYRGGGPKHWQGASQPLSFDHWVLQQALAAGAQHIPQRAHRITWEDEHPVVYTRKAHYRADFLVLATGVNSRPPLEADYKYRPPKTATMAQDEILMPAGWSAGEVRAYFRSPRWLTFGAMIPKNHYLNISLLGKDIPPHGIDAFLESIRLPRALEPQGAIRLCGCTPKIAVGMARPVCGQRWVAVGDAAVSRLYKDGIGSAFYTARAAMQSALTYGIDRYQLQRHYAPYCRRIVWDNLCGRILFAMWHVMLNIPPLMHTWCRALQSEAHLPRQMRLHERILWGMFTGDEPYHRLLRLACSPVAVWRVMRALKFQKK